MSSILKYILLYFTPLVYWGFYHYVGFNPTYAVYVVMIYTVLLLMYLFPTIFKRYNRFSYSWYLKGIICIILFSMLMAFVFWGQSMLLTYRATVYQFAFLYYFILLKFRVTPKEIVSILFFFGVIYVILWGVAVLNAPIPVFSDEDEIDNTRGTFRIIINSLDIILLLYCYTLVWIQQRYHLPLSIVSMLTCVVLLFTSLTRSIMASLLLVTCLFILLRTSKKTKFVFFILLFISYPLINSWIANNDTINAISQLNEKQFSDFSEDNSSTRISEYRIGFLEYKRNPITFLFGSGWAHGHSDYGQYEKQLLDRYNFNRSDAGYPSIFVSYGLVGLLLFLGLFFKVFKDKSGGGFNQYKMYIIVIAAINVLQDATSWYAIATCIAVYMLERERLSNLSLREPSITENQLIQIGKV